MSNTYKRKNFIFNIFIGPSFVSSVKEETLCINAKTEPHFGRILNISEVDNYMKVKDGDPKDRK